MKYIFLLSHGEFAVGLKHMAEMVLGSLNQCICISFKDGMGIENFKKEFAKTLKQYNLSNTQCMFLCDLKNGTPYNVCLEYLLNNEFQNNTKLLYGMSFPMLLASIEWSENQVSTDGFENYLNETLLGYCGIHNAQELKTTINEEF